jgi:sarcosine oxidase
VPTHVPFVVVGAGGAGAAAAYGLARAGQRVLLLEQHRVGHDRGSSAGPSRIFRLAYEEPDYARMALAARAAWHELERDAGRTLYWRTGGLDLGPAASPALPRVLASLSDLGARAEVLDRGQLRRRFPQWQVPEDWQAVWAEEAGIVNASLTVEVLAALASVYGAEVREGVRVEALEPGERPTVRTTAGTWTCDRLILAAGAWLPELLPTLLPALLPDLPPVPAPPLRPTLEAVTFYRPRDLDAFRMDRFPVFITHDGSEAYGFPLFGLPGVKLGLHAVGPQTTAETRSFEVPPRTRARSDAFMARFLPLAAGPVMQARTCLYTSTPDQDFLLAAHPACPAVIVASPCSGHGFKFMPLIGQILAALALDRPHAFALPRFGWRDAGTGLTPPPAGPSPA